MNVIKQAKFETMEEVEQFVANNGLMLGNVFARSGAYLVNGKSIFGMLSLDLTKEIDVKFEGEKSEIEKALERNKRFLLAE